MIPLIVMPDSAGDPRAMFERVAAAVPQTLGFPVMLMAPDLSDADSIEAWTGLFAKLTAEHGLTGRGLVLGCGAGARHAQYFTLENPGGVVACAALSADAWASIDECPAPEAIRSVQWLIGCGTQESAGSMKRAEWFQVELAETGCAVDFLDWDADETTLPNHALENALRFFDDLHGDIRQAA